MQFPSFFLLFWFTSKPEHKWNSDPNHKKTEQTPGLHSQKTKQPGSDWGGHFSAQWKMRECGIAESDFDKSQLIWHVGGHPPEPSAQPRM